MTFCIYRKINLEEILFKGLLIEYVTELSGALWWLLKLPTGKWVCSEGLFRERKGRLVLPAQQDAEPSPTEWVIPAPEAYSSDIKIQHSNTYGTDSSSLSFSQS